MGHIIIKPSPDRDEYVYWSTVVEAPLAYGNRAEMLKHIERDDRYGNDAPEVRMARTDRHGSSSLEGFYGWDDKEFIYEQRGLLPRSKLFEACRLLDEDREPDVWDLVAPFEDETEVRRG